MTFSNRCFCGWKWDAKNFSIRNNYKYLNCTRTEKISNYKIYQCSPSLKCWGAGSKMGTFPEPVPMRSRPASTIFLNASFDFSKDFFALERAAEGCWTSPKASRASKLSSFCKRLLCAVRNFLFWLSILLSSRTSWLCWIVTIKYVSKVAQLNKSTDNTFSLYSFCCIFW